MTRPYGWKRGCGGAKTAVLRVHTPEADTKAATATGSSYTRRVAIRGEGKLNHSWPKWMKRIISSVRDVVT